MPHLAGPEVFSLVALSVYIYGAADAGVELQTLTDYEHVVEQALATGYIAESDVELLHEWRKDPANFK